MKAKETLTLTRDSENYFESPSFPSEHSGDEESIMFIPLVTIYLPTTTLRFSLCDIDITFDNNTYTAFPVEIGVIKNTVDNKRDNVDITISDVTDAFKIYLLSGSDFRGQTLEIGRIIYPDSLSDSSLYEVVFSGQMDEPSLDDGKSEFSVAVRDPMSNYTCGRTLMLPCNAVFGDADDCGATKATATGTVVAVEGTIIHIERDITDEPWTENYWKHGYITINGQSIGIIESAGSTVKTEVPFFIEPTGTYTVVQGCNKTFKFCGDQYNNQKNFSGCPGIPWELVVRT